MSWRIVLAFLTVAALVIGLGSRAALDQTFAPFSDTDQIAGAVAAGYWTGSITITKDTDPDDSTIFDFTASGGLASPFTLEDDGVGSGNIQSFASTNPGTYVFTELAETGYQIGDISCQVTGANGSTYEIQGVNDDAVFQDGEDTVEVTLAAGDTVNCTFTNRAPDGTLTVFRVVDNDDFGSSSSSDWQIHVEDGSGNVADSPQLGDATCTAYTLAAGSYTVSESDGPPGYDLTFTGDCNGSGEVTVISEQNVTCTLTNADQAPGTLTILKVYAVPDGVTDSGGNKGFFNLLIDGVSVADNVACGGDSGGQDVAPGLQLTVSETAGNATDLADFTTTFSGDCDGNGLVTVLSGESKTCTITNTVDISVPATCSLTSVTPTTISLSARWGATR